MAGSYSLSGGGAVTEVAEESDAIVLTTNQQELGQSYSLAAAGVFDLAGNAASVATFRAGDVLRLYLGGKEVRFGQIPGATDAVDELDAYTNANGLYLWQTDTAVEADYRPVSELSRWRLRVGSLADQAGRGIPTLTWDISAADEQKLLLLQLLDNERPVGAPIDLRAETSLAIDEDESFELVYGLPVDHACSLVPGWQLLGTPLLHTIPVERQLWTYRDGEYAEYEPALPLAPELGYWAFSAIADSLRQTGLPADGRIRIEQGWNLTSPTMPTLPRTGDFTAIWKWDASRQAYRSALESALQPGEAYWCYAEAAFVLEP